MAVTGYFIASATTPEAPTADGGYRTASSAAWKSKLLRARSGLMTAVIASVAAFSPVAAGYAEAETKEPFVFYSAQSNWDGYPINRNVSGWNAVLVGHNLRGANTGFVAFVMRWDAKKKCWGMDRDCRPPSWAVSQHMSYIGTVQANSLFIDIRQ